MENKPCLFWSIIAAGAFFLSGCDNTHSVSSFEKPMGNFIGKICDKEGAPVEGATVLLVPEGYLPTSTGNGSMAIDSTKSNASGYFGFNVQHTGNYNLLANNAGGYALRGAIPVNRTARVELPGENLLEPGSLSGTVLLAGMADHHSVVVLLPGTNRFTAPHNALGDFTVPALAPGIYKLRVLSTQSAFAVIDTSVAIVSGETTILSPITLPRKRIPGIKSFDVAFDSLMTSVTCTWTTDDSDIIDSFFIYLNRERNFKPVFTCDNSVRSVTFNLFQNSADTIAYQIAAAGTNGWEGPPFIGAPFIKKSAFAVAEANLQTMIEEEPFKNPDMWKYCFNSHGQYIFKGMFSSNITHVTKYKIKFIEREKDTGDIARNYDHPVIRRIVVSGAMVHIDFQSLVGEFVFGMNPMPFPATGSMGSVQGSDMDGNLYLLVKNPDSLNVVDIVKLDSDLNQLKRQSIPCDSAWQVYSIAVSACGHVMLYKPEINVYKYSFSLSYGPVGKTFVTVFDSALKMVKEFQYDGFRIIKNSLSSDDTVVVSILNEALGDANHVFYDKYFHEIGVFEPFSPPEGSFPCDSVSMNTEIFPFLYNRFIANYKSCNGQSILYIFDAFGNVVARGVPLYGLMGFYSESTMIQSHYGKGIHYDNNGYLYRSNSWHVTRYSLKELMAR